ncbi:hypothetical protein C0995_007403 [Termitomyces sp. Mi166|nr:hypothetical protein C0995_007403 [Termitomyces sp. Mi166\
MDLKWLFYTLLGLLADALDIVLTSVVSNRGPKRNLVSDVDHLNDNMLLELIANAPKLFPATQDIFSSDVCKPTPNTIAKPYRAIAIDEADANNADATEANVLTLLRAETTIPVPRVRRVIRCAPGLFWIVMDYIPGQTLAQAWPSLSTWKKIGIAFTLRRYIRQLRHLKGSARTPPGPPSIQGPCVCHSPMFGAVKDERGPFSSYSELSIFFNERHQMAVGMANIPQGVHERNKGFDDSEPLVLTHQDLNLRNVIMDDDGCLWVIDWAWAGYYPVWFEYTTMQIQNQAEHVSGTTDPFWKALIPFICGPYFTQERWWNWMAESLNYS